MAHLRRVKYILPLAKKGGWFHWQRLTGSLPLAINLNIPLIADKKLQEIYDLKVKLVSTDCMTKEFMSLFKEKESGYIQLPPRALANRIVAVYDALVSQDGWKVKQEADKEYQALAQSEQESTDEYFQKFTNTYWNRNSKYTVANAISEVDASRKLIDGLNSKFHGMKWLNQNLFFL